MLRSLLIGLVVGVRAATPLAFVSAAARRGALSDLRGPLAWLGHPAAPAVTAAGAGWEFVGDKLPIAPDRTIAPSLVVRAVSGAVCGAALAGRDDRAAGAFLGAVAAVGGAYLSLGARRAALRRSGAASSGFAEDALAFAAAWGIIGRMRARR